MTKRKTKRNAGTSQPPHGFKICKDPAVHFADDASSPEGDDPMGATRTRRQPLLFAIARDPHTIFVSWHIDWRCVFEKAMPADRQVHVRVIGRGATIQTTVAVEPMSDMHYLRTPGLHGSCRVEIGYFQPLDIWHSVATSGEVEMPSQRNTDVSDVDLATIPFHLNFQTLSNLFGTTKDTATARVVSEFQKQLLTKQEPNEPRALDIEILRSLNVSLPDLAAGERDFKNVDTKKLARHPLAKFRVTATSPRHGFEPNASA